MDINDIESRLKRVYASIGLILVQDHTNLVNFNEEISEKSGSSSVNIHLGPRDENEGWALIENVVTAIARLKDNLKNRMVAMGKSGQLVEDEINSSLVLQLITDLDNAFKHGHPIRSSRSGKNPKLINLTSKIRIQGSSSKDSASEQTISDIENGTISSGACIIFDLEKGTQSYKAADNTKLIIGAEVVDENMNYIVELDDMVVDSILKWELFINKYKLK